MAGDRQATGIMLALGCLVLLGVMPVIANGRPAGTDALTFALALSAWQVVFALPLFAMELRRPRRGIFAAAVAARSRRRGLGVALVTGGMFGLSTYLYVLGAEKAGAANAAIAMQAYPLFAILWESLFLGRRKTRAELVLTAILVAALFYLGTGGTWQVGGLSRWFLVALGVPLLWSVAHVMIREELTRTPATPVQVTFFRVAISTLFLVATAAAVRPELLGAGLPATLLSAHAIGMGLVYYLELIVWFHAVRHIDVSLASSITTPWPALTMALAAILLGDPVAIHQLGALAVVVACIYGLTLASLRRRPAAA